MIKHHQLERLHHNLWEYYFSTDGGITYGNLQGSKIDFYDIQINDSNVTNIQVKLYDNVGNSSTIISENLDIGVIKVEGPTEPNYNFQISSDSNTASIVYTSKPPSSFGKTKIVLFNVPKGTIIDYTASFEGTGTGGVEITQNNVDIGAISGSYTTTIDDAEIGVTISGGGPNSSQCIGCELTGILKVSATYNGQKFKFIEY